MFLKGLCHEPKFDHQYSWFTDPDDLGFYSFRGYKDTKLSFDSKLQQWKFQIYSNSSIYAIANATNYPVGTLEWEFHGEPCYAYKVTRLDLNLNTCNDTEFNCQDGSCIPLEQRCDRRVDCDDKSGKSVFAN